MESLSQMQTGPGLCRGYVKFAKYFLFMCLGLALPGFLQGAVTRQMHRVDLNIFSVYCE